MRIITRALTLVAAFAIVAPTVTTLEGCSASAAAKKKKKKGATAKGAAAKTEGQKTGGAASGAVDKASDKGETYEEVPCDAEYEGVAWCEDDSNVVFCSSGKWYALDCSASGLGVCSEDLDSMIVDCNSAEDSE